MSMQRNPLIGFGSDAIYIQQASYQVHSKYAGTSYIHYQEYLNKLQIEFNTLKNQWILETIFTSSLEDIINNGAYRRIIDYGKGMLLFILKDLANNGPNHWFYALQQITGENPIEDADAGNLVKMTESWMNWAKQEHYIN